MRPRAMTWLRRQCRQMRGEKSEWNRRAVEQEQRECGSGHRSFTSCFTFDDPVRIITSCMKRIEGDEDVIKDPLIEKREDREKERGRQRVWREKEGSHMRYISPSLSSSIHSPHPSSSSFPYLLSTQAHSPSHTLTHTHTHAHTLLNILSARFLTFLSPPLMQTS